MSQAFTVYRGRWKEAYSTTARLSISRPVVVDAKKPRQTAEDHGIGDDIETD